MAANQKTKVAMLSIISNSTLIIFKLIAGVLSGSVSIISEAIHSSMDLAASLIAYFSVKYSDTPADRKHPYGHGKMENISGVIEGLLIFIAAFLIIEEAVKKIINPTEISETTIAIGVMFLAALINTIVSRKIYKVAKAEDSVALEADALHLKTDVYTSLGVGAGLLLIKLTGLNILDPIAAITVALLIIKEAWLLCRNAFRPLLDAKLPDDDEAAITDVLANYNNEIMDYHQLRTRKSGHIKHIDFHMSVNDRLTVKDSHDLVLRIKEDIEARIKYTDVNIHLDPVDVNKDDAKEMTSGESDN